MCGHRSFAMNNEDFSSPPSVTTRDLAVRVSCIAQIRVRLELWNQKYAPAELLALGNPSGKFPAEKNHYCHLL